MTNEITFKPPEILLPPPDALIQFEVDALSFIVCGIKVFRLTSSGMEYKGQVVEDAGVAYREITEFFSSIKKDVSEQVSAQPVSASERLPSPVDCDVDGRCWWWWTDPMDEHWEFGCLPISIEQSLSMSRAGYTHWLPANALPVPATNTK
jgi:hypothetical protein